MEGVTEGGAEASAHQAVRGDTHTHTNTHTHTHTHTTQGLSVSVATDTASLWFSGFGVWGYLLDGVAEEGAEASAYQAVRGEVRLRTESS